jgi:hypothetical protein
MLFLATLGIVIVVYLMATWGWKKFTKEDED